ncbi:hypothetical protein [Aquimarina agarilytica]|uniref:hypothetical protein n=1 Tax=Aquimarina agarilytica TaxID=1087449 RepID=UPI0012FB2387|nr:hypothetical protein [Aquimarina agarilytica]
MFLKKSCGKEIIQTNCLQLVLEKDTLKALLSDTEALFYTKNEKELLNIKVKYTNNNIKELIIDNNKIISRKNSLFTGIISLLIGVFFLLFFKWIWSRK